MIPEKDLLLLLPTMCWKEGNRNQEEIEEATAAKFAEPQDALES